MKRKRPLTRRRRFKPTSSRKHSPRDLAVFEFLWMWKVASTPMLKEAAFRGKTDWWVYKALRQLEREKYIHRLPRGRNIEQELWTLTDHGYEVFLMDRDDIKEYRYRVHAPAHDFLATCLQLGEIWTTPVEKRFYTEQMLASLAPSNFPKDIRKVESHIPDGITVLPGGVKEAIIGYEVDLNLKEDERYLNTLTYYLHVRPHLIVWLVRNEWIATRIAETITNDYQSDRHGILAKAAFVLTDDFKENIWGAKVIRGQLKGHTLRKLHANLLQSMGKPAANFGQKPMKEVFFPKYKSPQKLIAYQKGEALEVC